MRSGAQVSGSLSFMVFSSDFQGTADGPFISFHGSIETPIGPLDYDAEAEISAAGISGKADTRLGTMTFSSQEGRRKS